MSNNYHTYKLRVFQKTEADMSEVIRNQLNDINKSTDTNFNHIEKFTDASDTMKAKGNALIGLVEGLGVFDIEGEAQALQPLAEQVFKHGMELLGYTITSVSSHLIGDVIEGYKITIEHTRG